MVSTILLSINQQLPADKKVYSAILPVNWQRQISQLTFKAGDKEFTVDVKAGDTLQSIRKRINSNGDNFSLSANIVNTADGQAKLVLDSGVSGDGKNLTVTASTAELKIFETGAAEQNVTNSGCQQC